MSTNSEKRNRKIELSQEAIALKKMREFRNYDALGNRVIDQNGSFFYGTKKQRLEQDWKYTYLYDLNGNIISKILKADTTKIVNYEYTSQNQLVAIKEYEGIILIKESYYSYDALGRRVKKEHLNHNDSMKSFVKKFIYDGQSILFEINADNDLLATYTHSLDRIDNVLAMDRDGSSYYYLKDHLGTVTEIINSSGSIIQKYIYSSFGAIVKIQDNNGQTISSPVVENFFTYTGRESDFESGLNYYRARYYDASIGRFTSVDPDAGKLNNPLTYINKYIYAGNNAVNLVDPLGESWKKIFSVALACINPLYAIGYINIDKDALSAKDRTRLTNAYITSVIIISAIYLSPGTAATTLGGTTIARWNKGNPFDDLHFAGEFALFFSASSSLEVAGFTDPTKTDFIGISRGIAGSASFTLLKNTINSPSSERAGGRGFLGTVLGIYYLATY